MNALDFWVGLVLRGGSVGGASAIRSSCRSGERRTSFRGERGDCGGFHWFASPMIGLEMSRGLSFLEKRRKIDAFLNSGGGCVVSIASMMSNVLIQALQFRNSTLVQEQAKVGSEMSALRLSKKQRRSS
jgi:hypothetical protein